LFKVKLILNERSSQGRIKSSAILLVVRQRDPVIVKHCAGAEVDVTYFTAVSLKTTSGACIYDQIWPGGDNSK
jgi:hypothetical protein